MKFDELYKEVVNEGKVDGKVKKLVKTLETWIDTLDDEYLVSSGALGDVKVLVGEDSDNYNMSGESVDVAIYYGDGDAWEHFSSSSKEDNARLTHSTLDKIAKKMKFEVVDLDDSDMIGFRKIG